MDLTFTGLIAGVLGLLFAGYLVWFIMRQDPGDDKIKALSRAIQEGASAFLRREYRTLAFFTVVMFVVLAAAITPRPWVGVSYLMGTVTSALAGYLGMTIATRTNGRTAHAAIGSYARALKIAFSGGAVMGFTVVGLGLVGLTFVVLIFKDTHIWLGYAMGASLVALFLRVGGGIFTKSADVGADLVGKVEAGIPEDDPRNPAVIADNVGDNVGDIAGMGSDLYESYVSGIAASMVLGILVYGEKGVILPLLLSALGVVASIIGALFVRPPEVRGSFEEQASKARRTMNLGIYVANLLAIVGAFFLIFFYLGRSELGVFWATIAGLIAGFLIGMSTEYFTSERGPVRGIAKASATGAATNIIQGLSVGMLSTVIPILLVAAATIVAYYFAGLFGIAIASTGMLVTLGIVLAADCYGPIADNAAGIAEMAGLGKEVRSRTEALDSVGNTTAAIGKGFAIASAALAALAWVAAFLEVSEKSLGHAINISIMEPSVVVGLLIGAMISFLFSALAMRAVGAGAFAVVNEVRRQFKEITGLMEGKAKPDYARCVDIATSRALRSLLLPGILVILVPLIIGFIPQLGLSALAGFLVGALLTGFLLAITMANAGGAWDNAKKYIEAGHLGGKGSDAHKAAVIGDTVGDPFKDTAGPCLNILIKLIGKVAVIFVPLFIMVVA